jgi:hypothetical protein
MSRKASLTETDLRDVREDLVERITDQQEAFGILPRARQAEEAVGPILEKIDRDHERQRDRDTIARAAARPAQAQAEDVKVTSEVAGSFDFATGKLVVSPEMAAKLDAREGDHASTTRRIFHRIRTDPAMGEWKAKVTKILFAPLPPGHTPQLCAGCGADAIGSAGMCRIRETALRVILAAFIKAHGHPDKPRARKIFSRPQKLLGKQRI